MAAVWISRRAVRNRWKRLMNDGPVIFDWNNARNEENTSGIDIDPDYDEYINEPYFSSTNDINNLGGDVIDCAIYIYEQ